MKKKVLIYYPEDNLKQVGGPAGYLWNLKQGLDKIDDPEIQIDFYKNTPKRIESNIKVRIIVPKRILEIRRAIDYARFLKKTFPIDESLKDFDYIHFHWTEEMFLNRNFLKDYAGKVILTSHSPCAMHKEKIARLNPKDYKFLKKEIDKLEEMDRYSFTRADHVIFPCEEAEEPYYNTWQHYKDVRDVSKYHYVPTGIIGCSVKVSREEYRKKYNIPENAFVVSYAGRHNEIKGYYDLKAIGQSILEKNPNVYFLIAGVEEPIKGLNDDRWIEVGWTNDPHSLIAASDVFMLPNKETYFDLILLEVISLGVPVLMTETGGNKYFKQFNCSGLNFYNINDEAVEKINQMLSLDESTKTNMHKSVYELFKKEFTVDVFAKKYLNILKEIIGQEKYE
jgi:glycosyltransferase involved in cell wall biosynthesis